jgi:hypothetical protein
VELFGRLPEIASERKHVAIRSEVIFVLFASSVAGTRVELFICE